MLAPGTQISVRVFEGNRDEPIYLHEVFDIFLAHTFEIIIHKTVLF